MNYIDVIKSIIIILTFVCLWYFIIRKIKPSGVIKDSCVGRGCTSIGCNKDNCNAGYCIGEDCKAGNCVGLNCRAGNCFGYKCTPGKCIDKKCINGLCPSGGKKCTDGKAYKIKRPLYYKVTKYFPNDTFFNPPLCYNSHTIKDFKLGRGNNIGIKSLNIHNKGNISYEGVFNSNLKNITGIRDNDKINYTIPVYSKNDNCKVCIGKICE